MCFGSQHLITNAGDLVIKVKSEPVERVPTYKYLGIVMDEKLTFNNHVNKTIKSASYQLSLLRRVRPMLTPYAALQIYKAMILPVIEYGNILYDTANANLLAKLQTIQNKALKVVYQAPRLTPSVTTHNEAKIKPLKYRRKFNLLVCAYRRSWLTRYVDKRPLPTRKFALRPLLQPGSNKEQSRKSVAYRSAKAWNSLESKAKQAASLPL